MKKRRVDMKYLLSDKEVAAFIVNGYHLIKLDIPDEMNQSIAGLLEALESNPGDKILEEISDLQKIIFSDQVEGVISSLLGHDYELHSHRHWHCKQAHSSYMHWHQDSVNSRVKGINCMLGLYYPADVTADMGPTVIVPGTHFRNCPTDRMQHYTNIRGQVPLVVKAGTFALTHYDLWHGTAANKSDKKRHMIKFLFNRTNPNDKPSWNHIDDSDGELDWNGRRESVNDLLTFSNPLGCSQSEHYKERHIRKKCWAEMKGIK